MNKSDYVAALTALMGNRDVADCNEWPLTHTWSSSAEFGKCVRTDSPELKSKRLRGTKSDNDDLNQDFVFCYAAPRRKPLVRNPRPLLIPPVVLVFRSQSESRAEVEEFAHPFDTGGLSRLFGNDRTEIRDELTFQDGWRNTLGLFVSALFDNPDAYLRGYVPNRPEPLAISAKLTANQRSHDPLFFTWEVKTTDHIPFQGRLIAALVSLESNGLPTIGDEAYQQLVSRERRHEIRLITVRHDIPTDGLDDALFALFRNTPTGGGWTT